MELNRRSIFSRVTISHYSHPRCSITDICRDDHQLLSWNISTGECTKVAQLSSELFPTDLQFLPRISGSLGKHGDLILITSADGKFYIINKTGRIERTVEAHKGAVLIGQWGNDGVSLLTGQSS